MAEECIFCKIASGKTDTELFYETDDVVAFADIDPVASTHILIVPKSHVQNVMDIDIKDDLMNKMIEAAQKLIEEKKLKSGYKLIFNGGKYQYVPHLHWHLLAGKLEKKDDPVNKT